MKINFTLKVGACVIFLFIAATIVWYLKSSRIGNIHVSEKNSISLGNSAISEDHLSRLHIDKKPLFSLEGYDLKKMSIQGLSHRPFNESAIVVSHNYNEVAVVDVKPKQITISVNSVIIHQREIPDGWVALKPVFGKSLSKYAYTLRKKRASVLEKDPDSAILITDSMDQEFDWLADIFSFNEKGDIAYLASSKGLLALYINNEPVIPFVVFSSTARDSYDLFFSDDGKYLFFQVNKENSFVGRVDLVNGNKWEILAKGAQIREMKWYNNSWSIIQKDTQDGSDNLIVNGEIIASDKHIWDVIFDKKGNIGYLSCSTEYFEENCYKIHVNGVEFTPLESGIIDLLAINSDALPIYTIGNSQPIEPEIDDSWTKYYLVNGREKISPLYVFIRLLAVTKDDELIYEVANSEKIYDKTDAYIVVKNKIKKLENQPIRSLKLSTDEKYVSYPIIEGNIVYLIQQSIIDF